MFLTKLTLVILGTLVLSGCAAHSKAVPRPEGSPASAASDSPEAQSALKSVAESLSGQALSEEDLKKLSRDLRKNPEVQSAVESVTGAFSNFPAVKYCPVDGKRFSADQTHCPEHGVELQTVEN